VSILASFVGFAKNEDADNVLTHPRWGSRRAPKGKVIGKIRSYLGQAVNFIWTPDKNYPPIILQLSQKSIL
jgi:hypothetical protein